MAKRICLISVCLMLFMAGCGSGAPPPTAVKPSAAPVDAGGTSAQLTISSPAFQAMALIPAKYTCTGEGVSPPLEWSGIPQGAQSLALLMDDPDAPGGDWVHWIVYNLLRDSIGLPQGASAGTLPAPARQGKTSSNQASYGGPCPPSGTHHYHFHLYALDITLALDEPDKAALLKAMQGHILGQGELVGLYAK